MARRQQRNLISVCFVGEDGGYTRGTRNDEARSSRALAFKPFVAFQSSIGRISRLAFLERDLDAINAAVLLIDEFVIVDLSIGIRNPTYSVRTGSVDENRYKLLALTVNGDHHGKYPKWNNPR